MTSSQNSDNIRTISFFSRLLKEHGNGHKVLNWGSKQSQELRFKVLADMGISKYSTLLDVGCGLGDFYLWQKEKGLDLDYHGIDITPGIIESAKNKFPEALFSVADSKQISGHYEPFDYVIASGIFYLRKHEPVKYLEETIAQLYALSRNGLAFNSLSSWNVDAGNDEFYADPLKTLAFCRTITPYVTLRHDYHSSDFTVYMYSEPASK